MGFKLESGLEKRTSEGPCLHLRVSSCWKSMARLYAQGWLMPAVCVVMVMGGVDDGCEGGDDDDNHAPAPQPRNNGKHATAPVHRAG